MTLWLTTTIHCLRNTSAYREGYRSITPNANTCQVRHSNRTPNLKPSLSCEACIKGKASHNHFPKEANEWEHRPGNLTYSNLWGSMQTPSLGQSKYYIQFTDDMTHHCTIRFMKEKLEAFERIKDYVSLVENQLGQSPKFLCFDSGSEYINDKVCSFCALKSNLLHPILTSNMRSLNISIGP